MEGEMWKRQKSLNLNVPKKVVVIGAGGVGSWVAYFLARLGVKELVIADPDEIEIHNLNRTPFNIDHVGMKKVEALEELIYSFRDDIEIISIPEYILEWRKEFEGADIIVDARDTTAKLPFEVDIKLTYDGKYGTIWVKPNEFELLGEGEDGYTTVPSYVGTPVFLAILLVNTVASGKLPEKPTIKTFSIDNVLEMIVGGV